MLKNKKLHKENSFKSPILIIIFNRSKYLKKISTILNKIKPLKIYIAADGPRKNVKYDLLKCKIARKTLLNNINWKCKILKKFSKKNLGVKKNIIESLNWFFQNESKGIILEDDCYPNISFFKFCDELLKKYEDNNKIKMISGNFYFQKNFKLNDSYFFSQRPGTHGWATWARSWAENDIDMKKWKGFVDFLFLVFFFKLNLTKSHYFFKKFKSAYLNKIKCWDYQWLYSIWKNNGLIIRPSKNLCKHIGWGPESTHGKGRDTFPKLKNSKMNFPLTHPNKIYQNNTLDNFEDKIVRKLNFISYFKYKLLNKIKTNIDYFFKK
jgi:hypothetical protein